LAEAFSEKQIFVFAGDPAMLDLRAVQEMGRPDWSNGHCRFNFRLFSNIIEIPL
jgi:hypothetical protein